MNKEMIFIKAIIVLMAISLIIITTFVVIDKINQERCYNLPLNEFYADNSCLKYKEVLK